MTCQGFIFDLNKCTGCHACQIACTLENQVEWGTNWRQVITFNGNKNPELPCFHLSFACNNCMDAPCVKYCPSLAISKDKQSGVVLISDSKCIGCKYCSWVCPFDAPQFNYRSSIMEKCTLCNHRLQENLAPACVVLCPTDALQFGSFSGEIFNDPAEGFTRTAIRPAVQLVPLRPEHKKPELTTLPFTDAVIHQFEKSFKPPGAKTSFLSEWSLLSFTFIIPLLVSWMLAHFISVIPVQPYIFLGLAIVAITMSTMHLGQKFRAYRSIFNLRGSWLSREIFFFLCFVTTAVLSLSTAKMQALSASLAAISGISLLFSADKVYQMIIQTKNQKYHSADLMITGLFYTALLAGRITFFVLFAIIKGILFIFRKNKFGSIKPTIPFLSAIRIITGLILPIVLCSFISDPLHWLILTMVLMGEGIDRLAFYLELDPITPGRQMKIDFEKNLQQRYRT